MSNSNMSVQELVVNLVPSHLHDQVEDLLKNNGFKGNEVCVQSRHGDWIATAANGNQMVANAYHFSVDVPTGTTTELITASSFACGTSKMVFADKVRHRIPLREDSDTE